MSKITVINLLIMIMIASCSGRLATGYSTINSNNNNGGNNQNDADPGLGGNGDTYVPGDFGDLTFGTLPLYISQGVPDGMLMKADPTIPDLVGPIVVNMSGNRLRNVSPSVYTADKNQQYYIEQNSNRLVRVSALDDSVTEIFADVLTAWPAAVVSDNSLIITRGADTYFTKPGTAPGLVSTLFSFAPSIGDIYMSFQPLGKNYFLATHDGAESNKLLLLNGNNLTYSVVPNTNNQFSLNIGTLTYGTSGSAFTIYNHDDGNHQLYFFKNSNQTLTRLTTFSDNTYPRIFPLKNMDFLVVTYNTNSGTMDFYRINHSNSSLSLIRSIPGASVMAAHWGRANCWFEFSLITNLTSSISYLLCNPDGIGEPATISTLNMSTGTIVNYQGSASWNDMNTKFTMYKDNLYIVADVGSGKAFKKLLLENGEIKFSATNDLEEKIHARICESLNVPDPCNVTIDYQQFSIMNHHETHLVKIDTAYEWLGIINSGPVDVNGSSYTIDHIIFEDSKVYISQPNGGMNALLAGYFWFTRYLISATFI